MVPAACGSLAPDPAAGDSSGSRRSPMEALASKAKGVAALAKGAVAATQDEIRSASDVHSPAAPLRYRKNMAETVVAADYATASRNALLRFQPPSGARRAQLMQLVLSSPQSFSLLWVNGHTEANVSNLHRREKKVLLHVSGAGVEVERTETKKAEARVGPFDWWQISQWECGAGHFCFTARRRAHDGTVPDGGGGEQVFQFSNESMFGELTGAPTAGVGHAFDSVVAAYTEQLQAGERKELLSEFALAAAYADDCAAPIFAAKSPVPRAQASPKPLFTGAGLAPPPKSGLSKGPNPFRGSRASGSAPLQSPQQAVLPNPFNIPPSAQSPTRPFAPAPRLRVPEPEPEPEAGPPQPAGTDTLLNSFFGGALVPASARVSTPPIASTGRPGAAELLAMGFETPDVDAALGATGDKVEAAADWLLRRNRAPRPVAGAHSHPFGDGPPVVNSRVVGYR